MKINYFHKRNRPSKHTIPKEELLNIGIYFQSSLLQESNALSIAKARKWDQIIASQSPSNLLSFWKNTITTEANLNKILSNGRNKFNELLICGPPSSYRWETWKAAIKYKSHRIMGVYESLSNKSGNTYGHIIYKDAIRTFSNHPFFSNSQNGSVGTKCLQNVLVAFSNYCKEVRYCQGINYLAGFLLLVSGGKEEESFWFLAILITKIFASNTSSLSGFYNGTFTLLKDCITDFMDSFKCKFPILCKEFKEKSIPEALWIQKWFMTMFLYGYNMALSIRIWDYILVEGIKGLNSVALSIIQHIHSQLLGKSDEAIRNIFSSLDTNPSLSNAESIINVAKSMKINASICSSFPAEEIDEKYINN
jgi:hypothetical protein